MVLFLRSKKGFRYIPENESEQDILGWKKSILEPKAGTIYVDYTGNFPIRSMEGKMSIFKRYNWSSNAILATPVKKLKNETTVEAFKKT